MFSRVYYWEPAPNYIGHSSLDIAFGAGPGVAEYVSWWPKALEGAASGGPGEAKSNYVDDKEGEGKREATAIVDLTFLDIWAMKYYWAQWKQANYYSVSTQNCAKAVAELLYVGGGQFSGDCVNYWLNTIVWQPINAYEFAQYIAVSAAEIQQNRGG